MIILNELCVFVFQVRTFKFQVRYPELKIVMLKVMNCHENLQILRNINDYYNSKVNVLANLERFRTFLMPVRA